MKIKRETYLGKLRELRGTHLIKVVTGIRRVGKSTLLADFRAELLASGVPGSRVHFVNFEERKNLGLTDWTVLHDEIEATLDPLGMNYVFLDEIQMVAGFERLLDSLFVKPDTDIYVTGSNAFLLSGELATLLSGRHISINVLPYSFAEFALAHPGQSVDTLFRAYINASTLPEAVNLSAHAPGQVNQYLRDVFETVVRKDIVTRAAIRDISNFESVVRFAFDSVGSFVSPRRITDRLNAGRKKGETGISHNTVESYLQRLTGAFVLYKADRYDIKGRNLLKTQQKYYCVDLGLKNAMSGMNRGLNTGHKLENIVYLELRRRYQGDIWVGKHDESEVDFVVQNHAEERRYYQVAWSAAEPDTLERELRPLRKIKDNYPKILLTADPDNETFEGIRKVNVVDWLAGNTDA
ncbi:MAG: ATP-binding protein [Candidatus Accumulibacter sp.]|jgi:predicted AAA+ superfamily ATPase|nr:ATP-binding protein [Accumulibacter sp.]